MRKNTAGQVIGAQMINATTGAAFTGSVTVYVTVDGGTQAAGSVGSGACTHEGNGFHTYAPAQAETNGDHVAFTFTGTGAIPATVQVYPAFPQTGDAFARLGAPAGASIAADAAAIKAVVDDVLIDTAEIGTDGNGLTALATSVDLSNVATQITNLTTDIGTNGLGLTALPWNPLWDAEVQSEVADALTAYDAPTNTSLALRTLMAAEYATATALATVDTVVDAILVDTADMQPKLGTPAGVSISADIAAIEAQTDDIGAAGAGLNAVPWNPAWDAEVQSEVADALAAYGAATATNVTDAAANVSVDEIQVTALADLFNTNSGTTYASAVAGSVVKEIADNAGGSALTAGAIADAVWDEAISGHLTAGSTGNALNAAGSAGDPWSTPLPGAYGSGTAGKLIGDNINATITSRASSSDLSTVAGYLDTEIAAILADTNELQTDWANGGRLDLILDARASQASVDDLPTNAELTSALGTADDAILTRLGTPAGASVSADIAAVKSDTAATLTDTAEIGVAGAGLTVLASAANLATLAGYVDTEVAAIKAKTDLIPAAPAAVGDVPSASTNAAAVLAATVEGAVTVVQSLRLANAALGGKASGLETTAPVYRDLGDTKDRIVATVDADGNRSAVTRDLT